MAEIAPMLMMPNVADRLVADTKLPRKLNPGNVAVVSYLGDHLGGEFGLVVVAPSDGGVQSPSKRIPDIVSGGAGVDMCRIAAPLVVAGVTRHAVFRDFLADQEAGEPVSAKGPPSDIGDDSVAARVDVPQVIPAIGLPLAVNGFPKASHYVFDIVSHERSPTERLWLGGGGALPSASTSAYFNPLLPLILLVFLSGCAGTGGAGCEAWRPVLVADADVLTPDTARAILAHNLTGRRLCGW